MSSVKAYDYIVIGSGASGSIVAARLSEDPKKTVLLLEAGGSDQSLYTRVPAAFVYALTKGTMTWPLMGEPEPGFDGRSPPLLAGRVLGGSTSVNGMMYTRGMPADYDAWRDAGCTGWGYDDVLPYFKRSETSWRGENRYHGGSGPLQISRGRDVTGLDRPLTEAMAALGYKPTDDINGENPEGFFLADVTVDKRGRRSSTSRAYLRPAMRRRNLTVLTNAPVTRIEIANGVAVGVSYQHHGKAYVATAHAEVILSAGAYISPKILMLSGIGDAAELARHGISVVHHLPGVGRNLINHVRTRMRFSASTNQTGAHQLRWDKLALSALRWVAGRAGFLSDVPNSLQLVLRSNPDSPLPDTTLYCGTLALDSAPWFPLLSKKPFHTFEIGLIQMRPKSRGHVTLRSSDPSDTPRILHNFYTEPEDIATLREAAKIVRKIYATPPQGKLVASELMPGPSVSRDDQIESFFRETSNASAHPAGTCSMGVGPDAVVDPQLRVHGIRNLRVADASIMPTMPGGGTYATATMIGEKASDLIRSSHT